MSELTEMSGREELLSPQADPVEAAEETTLRPRRLDEFVGQEAVKAQLALSIRAAAERGDAMDHVLFAGPPGLGKTSLARIVALELGVAMTETGCRARSRRRSTRRWRTASSRSRSASGRARGWRTCRSRRSR